MRRRAMGRLAKIVVVASVVETTASNCAYSSWTASAIQTYTFGQFQVLDTECNVLPSSMHFQAVGDISDFNGTSLNYTDRPELVDISRATFPGSVTDITFDNIGVTSLENKAALWRSGLLSLTLKNMVLDALPSTLPPYKVDITLNNLTLNNMASFRAIKPRELAIINMANVLLQQIDWSGMHVLRIYKGSFKTISDIQLRNLTDLSIASTSVPTIANVELPASLLYMYVVVDVANTYQPSSGLVSVDISNWVMTNTTFTLLNQMHPQSNADDIGYTLTDSSAAFDTAAACTGGTVQSLWTQFHESSYHVCVLHPAPPLSSSSTLLIGVVGAGIAVVAGVVAGLWWRRKTRATKASSDFYFTQPVVVVVEQPSLHDTSWSLHIQDLAMVRIDVEDVVLDTVVGSGAFATVWLGSYRGTAVAIKKLHAKHISMAQLQSFVDEIKLMSQFDSPYIVKLIGACWVRPTDVQCVMEFMDIGDLREYLTSHSPQQLSWREKIVHIHDIAEGLVYLHSMDIIHRDVKSRNVLLDSTKRTKLTDFGISKDDMMHTMTLGIGTFRWMAPEVIQDQGYTVSADMYSFGMVMTEFDSHDIPFHDVKNRANGQPLSDSAIMVKVVQGSLIPTLSDQMPSWLRAVVLQCLAKNPSDRPRATQVAHIIRTQMLAFE
ncbi:Aste57867_21733 [Aphanomyces stellatus]|uniref:Aste57867_21733 protein n=1 Tax=Aphanomyces stellatus TaxID=120398 RepID=A0A485LJI8_9STRA|nr:hypothetical protein As57867_021664 [Aphanomyces stellatus]VFT98402.1 Aste57867_21733 [Aphanomyces stellatus]